MPLESGKSQSAFKHNIKTEMAAGKSQKQSVAIAYSESGRDEAPSARMADVNGYITIENNPISRSGIFPYLGKSISKECEPDRIYNVYRPAEELEKPDALDSFKLLPFVDEHDMLGIQKEKLLAPEAKGVQGSTGENITFKDGVLYATIKIFSQSLLNMIRMGKRELSLGYWCKFIKRAGAFDGQGYEYIQTALRGNHLALVERGRNDVAVLDNNMAFDHFDLALDTEELKNMAYGKDGDNTAKGDQEAKDKAAKDKAVKDAMEKKDCEDADEGDEGGDGEGDTKKEMSMEDAHAFMKEMMPKIAKINALLKKHGGAEESEKDDEAADPATDDADFKPITQKDSKTGNGKGVTDAEEEEKMKKEAKDKEEKDEKGAMDAAIKTLNGKVESLTKDGFKTIMKEAAARDQLANQLSQFVGTFDHAEMTQNEVAAYGVEKLGIKCAKGQELTMLSGYLHDRKPATAGFAMDSNYGASGKKGKYAESKLKRA